jgi:hypothetical protein
MIVNFGQFLVWITEVFIAVIVVSFLCLVVAAVAHTIYIRWGRRE